MPGYTWPKSRCLCLSRPLLLGYHPVLPQQRAEDPVKIGTDPVWTRPMTVGGLWLSSRVFCLPLVLGCTEISTLLTLILLPGAISLQESHFPDASWTTVRCCFKWYNHRTAQVGENLERLIVSSSLSQEREPWWDLLAPCSVAYWEPLAMWTPPHPWAGCKTRYWVRQEETREVE